MIERCLLAWLQGTLFAFNAAAHKPRDSYLGNQIEKSAIFGLCHAGLIYYSRTGELEQGCGGWIKSAVLSPSY